MSSRLKKNVAGMKRKMPDPRKATLYPIQEDSEFASGILVEYAAKKPMELKVRISLNVEIETESCVWMVWADEIPESAGKIERDWKLVDKETGDTWRVLAATLKSFEQRYRIDCIIGFAAP